MKFLRAATRALFYDYPLDVFARYLKAETATDSSSFFRDLEDVLKWTENNFTMSEIQQLSNVIQDDWLGDSKDDENPSFERNVRRSFGILNRCGKEFLDIVDEIPLVKFHQLLRWRELTLLIGEDIITTASIAYHDQNRGFKAVDRKCFNWPDILDHDNKELNVVLDRGLAETHAHLGSTGDNFLFNWIALMNETNNFKGKEKENKFYDKPVRQDYDPVSRSSSDSYSIKEWCVIAANIRCLLFSRIQGKPDIVESIESNLKSFFQGESDIKNLILSINTSCAVLKESSMKFPQDFIFDYALKNDTDSTIQDFGETESDSQIASDAKQQIRSDTNPYSLLQGERQLMYHTFWDVFSDNLDDKYAILFYIYLLIKNKVRREIIHTNNLNGFENFQVYDKSKFLFSSDRYKELQKAYAVQTALFGNDNNHLEVRIGPNERIDIYKSDYTMPLSSFVKFDKDKLERIPDNLRYVIHFFKTDAKGKKTADTSTENPTRMYSKRLQLWEDIDEILKFIQDNQGRNCIVGLDVAGSELKVRPEVFAPMYRWARYCGLRNFTYHAGEDYYDILDGLRTIYELMVFMEYQAGDRIGHAIALGRNIKDYYRSRDYVVLIPRQVLLDNLIWMKYYAMSQNITLQPQTQLFIEHNVSILLKQIGYIDCTEYEYWRSMLLRGDDITAKCDDGAKKAIKTCKFNQDNPVPKKAAELHKQYEENQDIRSNGDKSIELKVCQSYVDDIETIQSQMLQQVIKKDIVVECNPSSNCKIGGIKKYIKHPIFEFHRPDGKDGKFLAVSVNTDDRGVFFTNLRNEFSLLAIAMKKEKNVDGSPKYTMHEICHYISKLIDYGQNTKFGPVKVRLPNP